MISDEQAMGCLMEIISESSSSYASVDRFRDYRAVFWGSDQGRRVLKDIIRAGHGIRTTIVGPEPSIDPYRMAIHEGERNMALRILRIATAEPKEVKQAIANQRNDK